jgi:hypothetical protein
MTATDNSHDDRPQRDGAANVQGNRRLGFLEGRIKVPDDFDTMGREEIERLFYGDPE